MGAAECVLVDIECKYTHSLQFGHCLFVFTSVTSVHTTPPCSSVCVYIGHSLQFRVTSVHTTYFQNREERVIHPFVFGHITSVLPM